MSVSVTSISRTNIITRDKAQRTTTLKNLVSFVLVILATVSSCHAQPKTSTIDTFMHRLTERNQFNGSVLVAQNGVAQRDPAASPPGLGHPPWR